VEGIRLAPFFYSQLNNLDAIAYRQEVMQDLEDKILMQIHQIVLRADRAMREHLDQVKKIITSAPWIDCSWGRSKFIAQRSNVSRGISGARPKSRGLRAFRKFLKEYVVSAPFRNLYKWLNDGRCCGNSQEGVVGLSSDYPSSMLYSSVDLLETFLAVLENCDASARHTVRDRTTKLLTMEQTVDSRAYAFAYLIREASQVPADFNVEQDFEYALFLPRR